MSAAKRISKKRLKDDKFVDVVFRYGEMLREHQRLLLGGLLVVVVLILGLTWGLRAMRLGDVEAQQAFSSALKQLEVAMRGTDPVAFLEPQQAFESVRAQYGGKDVGKWAIYYVAYCNEQRGRYLEGEQIYNDYLSAQPKGEFAVAAQLGIATCNGGLGRTKRQGDMLVQVAATAKADSAQINAWLYQAGQVYMDNGYFELAKDTLTRIKDQVDEPTRLEIEQELKALAQMSISS